MSVSTSPNPSESSPGHLALPATARFYALVTILAAFGLRAYHLGYQSLISDEGISILRSVQPVPQMLAAMPVEHAPGYFMLLHYWMLLVGQSDFAIRYLSLLAGVFAVPLMLRMGIDFGSRRAGLVVATLVATNSFQVWYSQEARMYSWLLIAGALSTWCLWLLLTRGPSVSVWIGYVLSTTASIYIHHFGFLVPMVHIVVMLLWLLLRRNLRTFFYWAAAGLTVFLFYLPWMSHSLGVFGFSGWRPPMNPNEAPWLLLQAYTAGVTMPPQLATWIPWIYLAFMIVGATAWTWRKSDTGLFLTTVAVTSVLLTWLLIVRQPDFHVRYTIFLSAPLMLLAAGGISATDPTWWFRTRSGEPTMAPAVSIVQYLPWLITFTLVAVNGLALNRLYNDASVHKPDFRAAAQQIQSRLKAGDIVIVDGPDPDLVFNHYYSGDAPVVDLRWLEGQSDEAVAEAMEEITVGADRVWEVLYFKTPGPVQVWLATRGFAAAADYHNDIRTQLVALDTVPLDETLLSLYFGDALELTAYAVDPGPHATGDLVRVRTRWFTHAQAPEYKFSLRLRDENGVEITAYDYVPQNWFAPTNVWFVDAPAMDQYGLVLPDDLASGRYTVTLRLYDPYSGSPVDTAQGIDVPIGEVQVNEQAPESE